MILHKFTQIKKSKTKIYFLVLGFFLLLNFVTSGGHLYSIDDVQYFLHAENLALNYSLKINPESPSVSKLLNHEQFVQLQQKQFYLQGLQWSEDTPLTPFNDGTSLLLPFLTIPLYYLSMILSADPINLLSISANSIILSLTSLVIFIISMHYFKNQKIAFILSSAYVLTTFVWPLNTGMMLRPLAGLLFTLGFYFIITSNKNYLRVFISGSCIGLTLLASVGTMILLPGLVLFGLFYFYKNKKQIILFLGGFSLFIIIQLLLNKIRFDSYGDFGFGQQQTLQLHTYTDGLFGYIFSLGWGIPFNAPVLILFPIAVYFIWKIHKAFSILLAYCFLAVWLFHGTDVSPIWSGYGTWGPRYFTTVLPLLFVSIGFVLKELFYLKIFRIGFAGLMIFGFFVNLMGKLTWYLYGYQYGYNILKLHLMENWWNFMNYDISFSPITLHIMALKTGFVQNISGGWGLAPCPYDLFVYCRLGAIPFILLVITMILTGYILFTTFWKSKDEITI